MKSSFQILLLGAGFGTAFLLGQCFPRSVEANPSSGPTNGQWTPTFGGQALEAQGRGGVTPPPPSETAPPAAADEQIVYTEEHSSSVAANGFLAVTGSYGVGTSVMYLVDTVNRQLAVYEARGGSTDQRRIVLVGARKLDLDLQLEGYNDRSEFEYDDLQRLFAKRRTKAKKATAGQNGTARSRK